MCSGLLQLAPGSLDLVQAVKRVKLNKFTQNDNSVHPAQFWVLFFQFAQLYKTAILFSVWDKSHNSGANWSKLKHI